MIQIRLCAGLPLPRLGELNRTAREAYIRTPASSSLRDDRFELNSKQEGPMRMHLCLGIIVAGLLAEGCSSLQHMNELHAAIGKETER